MKVMNRAVRFLLPLIGLVAVAALAGAWAIAHHAIVDSIRPDISALSAAYGGKTYAARQVSLLEIPAGTKDLVVGSAELGQRSGPRSAERSHVLLNHHAGLWTVRNVALNRKLLLDYSGFGEVYARRWPLEQGDMFVIGGQVFRVASLEKGASLELETRGRMYRLEYRAGFRVHKRVNPESPYLSLSDQLCGTELKPFDYLKRSIGQWQWVQRVQKDKERTLWSFGGNLECSDRIPIAGQDQSSAHLSYKNGVLFLKPGVAGPMQVLLCPRERRCTSENIARKGLDFSEIPWPLPHSKHSHQSANIIAARLDLGVINKMIIGKTHYQVNETDQRTLQLKPLTSEHRFFNEILNPGHTEPEKQENRLSVSEDRYESYLDKLHTMRDERVRVGEIYWLTLAEQTTTYIGQAKLFFSKVISAVVKSSQRSNRKLWAFALLVLVSWFLFRYLASSRHHKTGHWFKLEASYRGSRGWLMISSAVLTAFFVLLSGDYYDDYRVFLGDLLILQWGMATMLVILGQGSRFRMMVFWLAMSVLIALGALTLELLAMGASTTAWIRFDHKQMQVLSVVFMAVSFVSVIHLETLRSVVSMATEPKNWIQVILVRWLPLVVLTFVFLGWVVAGREEGVGGIQPVELGKFMAVLIFAIVVTNLDHSRRYSSFLARLGGFAINLGLLILYFVSIFMLIPAIVSDYSPVLILVILGLVMLVLVGLWLWLHRVVRNKVMRKSRVAPPGGQSCSSRTRSVMGRYGSERLVIMFSLLAGIVLWVLAVDQIEYVKKTHDQQAAYDYTTPQERVAVWVSVEEHPELGDQLINSLKLIGATPCYQWEKHIPFHVGKLTGACGQPWFGINPDQAQNLAAVQDDFVMAFFINRFGLPGAILLMGMQLLVLWLMLDTAIHRYSWEPGDYVDDSFRQVLSFLVLGGAGLLALHWSISWANVFGLLPIMGQPMTWVSSGNSHVLGMALPILLSTLVLLRTPADPKAVDLIRVQERPVVRKKQPIKVALWRRFWLFKGRMKRTRLGDG